MSRPPSRRVRRQRWGLWLAMGLLAGLAAALVVPLVVPVPRPKGLVDPEELADEDSCFVDIDGVRIHYKDEGDPESRQSVMLLHGFASSLYSWRHAMAALQPSRRVVAFDHPGFGLSGRPLPGDWTGESPYTLESSAHITVALMEALGIDCAVLVGHSQGASIAVLVADTNPERVSGLVLINAPTASPRFQSRPYLEWIRSIPQLRRLAPLVPRPFFGRYAKWIMSLAYADPRRLADETVALELKATRVKDWDLSYVELTRSQAGLHFPEAMARIGVPTLVVAGRKDRTVPYRDQQLAARSIPGARFIAFYDTGHVVPEERPEAFAEVLGDFLDELDASGA
jgi:pimeloyl-ACP methyl ester carboxylesterase